MIVRSRAHGPVSRPRRRGTSIVELLVALPLAILTAAAAAAILVRVARTSRSQSSILSNVSALRHAGQVMTTDLAPLDGRDLVTITDSLLEFNSHVGVLEACGASGADVVEVAAASGTDDGWIGGIRNGDELRSWTTPDAPAVPLRVVTRRLRDVAQALAPAACGMGPRPVRRWRLILGDSVAPPAIGTPLLVTRAVRYEHYQSGSSWWLGRRSRDGAGWDGRQPVVGPLSSPARTGMVLHARSASGAVLTTPSPLPDSVASRVAVLDVSFRMSRLVRDLNGAGDDSAVVSIPLRASAAGRRLP